MSSNEPQPYPQAPQPAAPGYYPPAQDPGKVMGILSIIFPFVFLGLVGLILGIIGFVKSKKAGFKNIPAVIGIILSSLAIVGTIILIIVGIIGAQAVLQTCKDLGSGTHVQGGITYTCP